MGTPVFFFFFLLPLKSVLLLPFEGTCKTGPIVWLLLFLLLISVLISLPHFLKVVQLTPRRWLNLQEYQSKKLMSDNGVKVQRFFVADTANEALEAAKRLSKLIHNK